jgi:membrane-bound lytic murein transglycosylase MltF
MIRHSISSYFFALLGLAYSLGSTALELPPASLTPEEKDELAPYTLEMPRAWKGDFSGMQKRQQIRILVPFSKTFFYLDRGEQHGISHDLGVALKAWLDKTHPNSQHALKWHVLFVPVSRDQLLPALEAGIGDIAAGGLTETAERARHVDFTVPFSSSIREVLVSGPGQPMLDSLEQLAGHEVVIRPGSSYFEHLSQINQDFKQRGLKPIKLMSSSDNLEPEDLLEMVDTGVIPATVVDHYLALIWQQLYPDLQINEQVVISGNNEYAWAIRKNSPQLEKVLNAFVASHNFHTSFGHGLINRYERQPKKMLNINNEKELAKFEQLLELFQKHGETYNFDHLMLMAQGYQESHLDQTARSKMGAVGIMQMLPSTAADKAIAIHGIETSADKNIEAGSKYMRLIIDHYLSDPSITPLNRTLLAFAAYNAGPGNLRKMRHLAEKSGLDPNVWFQNVEHAAAHVTGRQTVDYVANIYKYYIAYQIIRARKNSTHQ